MKLCLDASVLVSLFRADIHPDRTQALIAGDWSALLASDFAGAEVSAAVARQVRTGELSAAEARSTFQGYDAWVGAVCETVLVVPADIDHARASVRRLDIALRAPDAIHLAAPDRLGATIATFDRGMAAAALALSIPVALP